MPNKQSGIAHILVLVAAVGLIAFILIANTADFKDRLFSSLFPKPSSHAAGGTIDINPNIKYQTIIGWEAVAQAGQTLSSFSTYKDYLFDQSVNDLGLNRLRVEVSPINATSLDFAAFDSKMNLVALPLKQKLEAKGEKLWISVTYVHKAAVGTSMTDSTVYSQAVLALYKHMQQTFGLVPDSWEAELEPGVFGYPYNNLANSIVAAGDLLKANSFPVYIVAPSSECGPATAIQSWQQMLGVNTRLASSGYVKEFAYHRYCGPSVSELQTIAGYKPTYNLNTSQLEHGGADYNELHDDLKYAQVSAWEQYTLAFNTSDNGYQYYVINTSGTTPQTMVTPGSRTGLLRQYFKYIRKDAQRIEATSQNSNLDPLAFINADGKYVVVIKSPNFANSSFTVSSLPAGTYGISYVRTDGSTANQQTNLPDQTIASGALLSTQMPSQGVITIYQKSGGGSYSQATYYTQSSYYSQSNYYTQSSYVNPTTTPLPTPAPIPGDVNGSGKVDIFDFNLLLTDFSCTSGTCLRSDINGSGKVDIFDYNILLTNFGKTTTPPTSGQVTITVSTSTDDVNETDQSFNSNDTSIRLGGCGSPTRCNAGLRFANVTIPRGATITSAHIDVVSPSDSWIQTDYQFYGEATDNATTFSSTSKPSQRSLTTAFVGHSDNVQWQGNSTYTLDEIKSVIQEIVNRPNWTSGNSLSLIIKSTDPSGFGAKLIKSFDSSPTQGAKLVISYQ